jgi:hypothetical protein
MMVVISFVDSRQKAKSKKQPHPYSSWRRDALSLLRRGRPKDRKNPSSPPWIRRGQEGWFENT